MRFRHQDHLVLGLGGLVVGLLAAVLGQRRRCLQLITSAVQQRHAAALAGKTQLQPGDAVVLSDPEPGQRTGDLCFASRGFSLHAARRVRPEQTQKLEELCRYVLRPPLANSRLRRIGEDELLLALKRKWSDGTTHILLTGSELLARLAALVPPKGFNGTRYHGVLAPRSSVREHIIPVPPVPDEPAVDEDRAQEHPAELSSRRRRIPWAELLRRVFRVDIEQCHCGGRLRLVAFVTDHVEARRYLEHVGLPSEMPEIAPARAPPQLAFESC